MKLRTIIIIAVLLLILLVTVSFIPASPPTEEVEKKINERVDNVGWEEELPLLNISYNAKEIPPSKETVSQEEIIVSIVKELQPEISNEDREEIAELTIKLSGDYNLDPYWMLAIMYTESRFRNDVVSTEGARGLMQLIPSTAKVYEVTKEQLHTPSINIDTGFQYYKYLLDKYDDQRIATIAYNQGPGNVSRGTYKTWYYDKVKNAYKTIVKLKIIIRRRIK